MKVRIGSKGHSSEALTKYNIKTYPFIGKRIMGRDPKRRENSDICINLFFVQAFHLF